MKANTVRIAFFSAALLALGTFPSEAWTGFSDWRAINAVDWQVTPAESSSVEHAFILFDGAIYDDSGDGASFYSRYRRIRVLDQQGLDDNIEVEIPYRKGQKLIRLDARVVKRDTREIEVQGDAVHEKTLLSGRGVRIKAKSFAFPGVEVGDLIEYRYTLKSENFEPPSVAVQGALFARDFAFTWYFQPRIDLPPDVLASYPEAVWSAAWTVVNAGRLSPSIEQIPEGPSPRQIEFKLHAVPALVKEPFMPPEEAVAARILCNYRFPRLDADKSFWERVSFAWGDAWGGFVKKSSRLKEWMKPIESAQRDLDGDIARCFALMRRDVVNVDFADETGKEDAPDNNNVNDVLEHKAGGSVDMSLLMTAMLRHLGYDASIFLVRDRSSGEFFRTWESIRQLTMSGVVVSNQGEYRWLFPAYPAALPSSVPWEAQNCDAFVIDVSGEDRAEGSMNFLSVPIAPPGMDRAVLEVSLEPGEGRDLTGRLRATWSCPSELTRQQQLRDKDSKEALEDLKGDVFPSKVEWSAFDETYTVDSCRVAYACSLVVRNLVEEAGERRFVDLGPIRLDDYTLPDSPRRNRIDLAFPVKYQSKVTLRVPAGRQLEALPARTSLGGESWRFESEATQTESALVLVRDLNIQKPLLGASAAAKLRAFFVQVYAQDRQTAVLAPKDAPR